MGTRKATINTSEDGIVYFDLTNRSLELKTSSSYRVIPLHNKLIEMNIHKNLKSLQLEFTQAGLSKFFNKNLKLRVTDNQNKIMYSFSHTVATELKRAEVAMNKVFELLRNNYENTNMTKEVYASRYTIKQLQESINKLFHNS